MQRSRPPILAATSPLTNLTVPWEVWQAYLARMINPIVRGWMNYYGAFYPSALSTLLARINTYLVRWVRKKYKRLRAAGKARARWEYVTTTYPRYFAHWAQVTEPLMTKTTRAV